MKNETFYDVVIIGGGPSGATASYFLAKSGLNVLLVESAIYPRYHIGESLLPASIPILEKMNLLAEMKKHFVKKPGGKWFVGSGEWRGDFAIHHEHCSFSGVDYSYMVERSKFDQILLNNSAKAGVTVIQPEKVESIIEEAGRVVGVKLSMSKKIIKSSFVFDCSGRSTFLANKFSLKINTVLNKQSIYSYFDANYKDNELKNGWFVGTMIPYGWIWAIPLSKNKLSVGVVMENDEEDGSSYQEKFNSILNEYNFLDRVLEPNYKQMDGVRFTKNIGYSTKKFFGEGWVTVGDAAFFIDPCFSSGVHMALSSGELAARTYLKHLNNPSIGERASFQSYENQMRDYELSASYMVRHFYNVSSHKRLQMFSASARENYLQKDFNTFVGGDFGFSKEFAKKCYDESHRVLQKLNNNTSEELNYFSL